MAKVAVPSQTLQHKLIRCVNCLQLFNVKLVVHIVTNVLERFKYKLKTNEIMQQVAQVAVCLQINTKEMNELRTDVTYF